MSLATVDTQLISQIQAIMWKLTSDGTCSNQPLIARLSILYAYSSVAVVCHSSSVSSCPMTDVPPPPAARGSPTNRTCSSQVKVSGLPRPLVSRPRLRASRDLAARFVRTPA